MTVSTEVRSIVLDGNGSTTVFPFSFPPKDADSIQVSLIAADGTITLLDPSTYTVSVSTSSGSVTYPVSGSALPSGQSLLIERTVGLTQETDLPNQGAFFASVHEDAFDLSTMRDQQQQAVIDRTFTVPKTEAGFELALAATRAGKVLSFDDAGAPETTLSTAGLAGLIAIVDLLASGDVATVAAIADDIIATADNDIDISLLALNMSSLLAVAAKVADGTLDTVVAGLEGRLARVSNLTALRAVTPVDGDAYHVASRRSAGDGGGGVWIVRSGDFSTEVANDPAGGIWLAFDSDPDGDMIVAQRLDGPHGAVNAAWFGLSESATAAVNAAALQAAIDFVSPIAFTFLAGQVEFASGVVDINSGVYDLALDVVTVPTGVRVKGASQGSTVFEIAGAGVGIKIGAGASNLYGAPVEDITIHGDGASFTAYNATPGQIGIQSNRAIRLCYFRNVTVWNCDTNIDIAGFAMFLENCYSMGGRSACLAVEDGTQIEIRGGRYEYCPQPIFQIGTTQVGGAVNTVGFTARQAAFQNGEVEAIKASGGIVHFNVEECFFEGNNNAGGSTPEINIINPAKVGTVVVRANRFTATGGAANGSSVIRLENIAAADISGNHAFDGNASAEYDHFVTQIGSTDILRISANTVSFDGDDGTLLDQQGTVENLIVEDKDGLKYNVASMTEDDMSLDGPLKLTNGYIGGAIAALTGDSTAGGLIEGREAGHIVIGIRENSAGDSFSIISGGGNFTTDGVYDSLHAQFRANGLVRLPGVPSFTTADATNMTILANGQLALSVSARKYKDDIRPIPQERVEQYFAIAEKSACSYISLSNSDQQSPHRRHFGMIADDFHDGGMPELVNYKDDEVEGFQYERVTALHALGVIEANKRIANLEARLSQLEGRANQ